jgi:hypothetical protein
MELFFITALVLTTKFPAEGWLQWTQGYSSKKYCESIIRKDYLEIGQAVRSNFGEVFTSIKEMRCLTYQEAVLLNSQLGH